MPLSLILHHKEHEDKQKIIKILYFVAFVVR